MEQLQYSAKDITASIKELLEHKAAIGATAKIMLTGGRGAKHLYKAWNEAGIFDENPVSVEYYLTDERCVPANDPENNYHLIKQVLFPNRRPRGSVFHRMISDTLNPSDEADRYGELLPGALDFMLLSMGEDGHIASLFPHSHAIKEANRKVVSILGPKAPFKRMTITPGVIKNAKQVFVLALGKEKRDMYKIALREPENYEAIPARLVLDRTWIFELGDGVIL